MADNIVFTIFLIFTGAALFATGTLFARQSMLLAYIALGLVVGPYGLGLVADVEMIQDISNIGIIFLLFLLGLQLIPQKLIQLFKKVSTITVLTSAGFAIGGAAISLGFGFSTTESLIIGAAMMFSSTIIGLKLLPTTVLHHQITGELMISILLLQDLIAIIILLLIEMQSGAAVGVQDIFLTLASLPLLVIIAVLCQRYVLSPLFTKFDQIQEYVFLVIIGWCMGIAELAGVLGLSHETGAFIAGVTAASSPIAPFIAEILKPLRDFFLVIFFFGVGAAYNWVVFPDVVLPALALAGFALLVKPWAFRKLLLRAGEKPVRSKEVGIRLANVSEFSLLIAILALSADVINSHVSYLIQTAVLMTFVASSYWIVLFYPSPMAIKDELRQL